MSSPAVLAGAGEVAGTDGRGAATEDAAGSDVGKSAEDAALDDGRGAARPWPWPWPDTVVAHAVATSATLSPATTVTRRARDTFSLRQQRRTAKHHATV